MAVEDWLSQAASKWPDRRFLETGSEDLTFQEAEESVSLFAGGLRSQGVARGTRVGVYGPNSIEMVLAIFSILRAGGVVVPLGSRFNVSELERQVIGSGVRAVLSVTDEVQGFGVPPLELLSDGGDRVVGSVHHDAEECAVVHTSGSSGPAVGVRLSWGNLEASAAASAKHLSHTGGDRWLLVLPVHHVGGLSVLIRSARQGSTVVLRERFSAEEVALDLTQVTLASLVPTMLAQTLPFVIDPPTELRAILLGGGPVPSLLLSTASIKGITALSTYGQTEAASQIATLPLDSLLGGALQPLEGMEVRVVGTAGTELSRDLVGNIEIRGPQVFLGYDGGPLRKATSWHRTGDLGSMDSGGLLRVSGRGDALIVSGGENVHPAEVVDALIDAGVREAAVFGTPSETWGHVVSAAVVTDVPLKQIEKVLRSRLAGYKIPRRWAVVDKLPRNSMGKIQRDKLPELLDG